MSSSSSTPSPRTIDTPYGRREVTDTDEHVPWWLEGIHATPHPRPTEFARTQADEFDVVIVGSGGTGLTTAILAHDLGRSVLVLEAAAEAGGTTYKSGFGMWIPNNTLMRSLGIVDDRDDCLRFMAQVAHPDRFDVAAERFGMGEWEWEKMTAFYDHASEAIEALEAADALHVTPFLSFSGKYPAMVSYHSHLDSSIQGFHRHVMPRRPDGLQGIGWEGIRQLSVAANRRGIEVRLDHRVLDVIQHDGVVVGVSVGTPAGEQSLYARQGVVFATGGFAHNLDLIDEFYPGPLYSSCAVGTARGDFVGIGRGIGADLAHMANGWYYEDLLETAAPDRVCMEGGIHVPPGDAMIYVNAEGRRVVNEKLIYQDRGKVTFQPGENGDHPHRVLFMIYDEFLAGDTRPWILFDTFLDGKPWVIKADTLPELGVAIQQRLDGLEELIGDMRLSPAWATELAATIERFNGFARTGIDEDFGRGTTTTQWDWTGPVREGNDKNPTMYPFRDQGPYYAVLICGMVLDTNGGPRTNAASQVLRADDTVIEGLYGAGNCVASVAGEGYLSGGSTLGPAVTFAYLAAQHVAQEPVRDLTGVRRMAAA